MNGGLCLDRHSFRGYDGRDGALIDLGANLLQAPIDNGIFNYLALINLDGLNFEIRIIVIIIPIIKMFRMI
jgi:hypothetical protein